MIVIALLALILMALLFPNAMRALIGIFIAFLCFAIAGAIEPDGVSKDNEQTEQVR
ncbi:MAG TPA: hypothetical protein VIF88_04300 [Methylocystis sp.]